MLPHLVKEVEKDEWPLYQTPWKTAAASGSRPPSSRPVQQVRMRRVKASQDKPCPGATLHRQKIREGSQFYDSCFLLVCFSMQ